MSKLFKWLLNLIVVGISTIGLAFANVDLQSLTLTMTNDPSKNSIQVYDTSTHALLQTIATNGKGGVSNNAFGIKQYNNLFFAAANNGSNSVTVFQRYGNNIVLWKVVTTTSAPVSIDFGHGHMYVAGATTVDSYSLHNDLARDGTANLVLTEGGTPPLGSTSQVGVVQNKLLVTLKTDPSPGTVDIISLNNGGAISGTVKPVAGPTGSQTPFGFTVFNDGSSLITLAHSNQLGLFRNDMFVDVIQSGQNAPCWATHDGKYVFVVNAASHTVSRLITTGQNIFIDAEVAASIKSGSPTDTDQNDHTLVVLDHTTTSHLNFFSIDPFGELQAQGTPLDLGVANANGVALMAP
jgi:hypothetical protein